MRRLPGVATWAASLGALAWLLAGGSTGRSAEAPRRPNVLLIITDDQGFGDLSLHGNPVLKTPNLDRLGRGGVRLTRFHVMPVCSPTRACLMTGRYNYRTRVVDTFVGRSMMDPAEVTLPQRLAAAGYRTGIFGKWHLGDCYPLRPVDRGFQTELVLKGGGIGQPSDPAGGESYFDPVLQRDGKPVKTRGYVTDVVTDATLDFLQPGDAPFFAYVAYNAPHDPLEVPAADLKPFEGVDLSRDRLPSAGYPLPKNLPTAATAKVYAMVANIDRNVGRLLDALDARGLARDTLVIFLTDNGPAQARYNAGMRGQKTTVYDGGIRVPCFVRLPGTLAEGREVDRIAAHIDLAPTILEACGVPADGPKLDGRSLWPLLTGQVAPGDWPSRTLFFQWHRGDVPEKFRAFAARDPRWKLVKAEGATAPNPPRFELFDVEADPSEQHDVAAQHPEVVARLKDAYSAWFDDVSATRGYDPPRIKLGSAHESPTELTRQDWRGPKAVWGRDALGHWEVDVDRPGRYRVSFRLRPARAAGEVGVRLGGVEATTRVDAGATTATVGPIELPPGAGRLEAWITTAGGTFGVWSASVERVESVP